MKVFLDTNVLVSACAARGICADLVRFILSRHELMTGEVNVEELRRGLREQFRLPVERLDAIEAELRLETIVPRPAEPARVRLRDADDARVLASVLAGGADLLPARDWSI